MNIYKIFTFEAAHRLPNVPPGHKCARLHGHSFKLEVHLEGPIDPKLGWVMDFDEVGRAFQPIFDQFDHNYLNEIPGLENPTSENIVRWVWERLKPRLPELSKIVLRETCFAGCEYQG